MRRVRRAQILNDAEGYHVLGNSHSRLGVIEKNPDRLIKAMIYLKKSVELKPNDPAYQETLKDCQKEHEDFSEKQKAATIVADDNNPDLNRLLSRYNLHVGKAKNLQIGSLLKIDKVQDTNKLFTFLTSIGIPATAIKVQSVKNIVILTFTTESIKIVENLSIAQKEKQGLS